MRVRAETRIGRKAGKCTGVCDRMVTMERNSKDKRSGKEKEESWLIICLSYRSGNELSGATWRSVEVQSTYTNTLN